MTEFVTHAFSAGVLAPAFYGRTDLDKYDLGLAEAENFYIDYTGGIKNRAGTRFCSTLPSDGRLVQFRTEESEDDLILVFLNEAVWFFQGGERLEFSGSPYALTTPYTAANLSSLVFTQKENTLTITSPLYAPRELTPDGDGSWTLTTLTFTSPITPPAGLTATPSASGSASFVFTVTAIDQQGNESRRSRPVLVSSSVNYTVTAGSCLFKWDAVADAVSYRVYRSIITENANMTLAQELGLIGETVAPSLVDGNIIPDFSQQPPSYFNPFADGAILNVKVDTVGTGYTDKNTVVGALPGAGTGGLVYPVANQGGLIGALLEEGGAGFSAPSTITITGGDGSSGVLEITEVSPASGNHPAIATYFQQRRVFSATQNLKNFIWSTKIGAFNQFTVRAQPQADDSYIIAIDSETTTRIKHLLPIRDGLLIFHGNGVDRLRAQEGRAITPLDNVVEPQASFGVGDVAPIFINNDVLYVTKRGTALHALSYTFYTNSYTPQDLSALASHLLGPGREPVRMVWQEEPDKLLWIVLRDGTFASLTYLREQEVYAWATHRTNGLVKDAALAEETEADFVYFLVERELSGGATYCLEVMQKRQPQTVEHSWFVDCGLQTELTFPSSSLTFTFGTNADGQATAEFDLSATPLSVGDIVRAFNGVFRVEDITGDTHELLVVEAPSPDPARPQSTRTAAAGSWSWATPITSVTGLAHLNGRKVSVLADGDAYLEVLVEDGGFTLDNPATLVTAGLPFEAYARTLPLADMQLRVDGKKKRIVGTAVRLNQTRGMRFGSKLERMYEMKDRGFEQWGQITGLRDDNSMIRHAAKWERDASLHMLQVYPLPATILGLVTEAEVGGL